MSLRITGGRVLTTDGVQARDVLVEGHTVARVVSPGTLGPGAADVFDATHCLVLPGLINAHTHLYQGVMRGLGDGLSVEQWLQTVSARSPVHGR